MNHRHAFHRHFTSSHSHCALIILMLASLHATGCSSFNQQWNSLADESHPTPQGQRWEGIWHSDVSGHEGKLRCMVLPAEKGQSLFRFSATWGPGIVSDYDIQMQVKSTSDGAESFEGDLDLGLFMGNYRCKGTIAGDQFRATYESSQDHGTFEMQRVK